MSVDVMKITVTAPGVTIGHTEVPVGDEIDLPVNEARRLIVEGYAKDPIVEHPPEKQAAPESGENDPGGVTEDDQVQTPSDDPKDVAGGENDDQGDTVEKVRRALNDQYKKPELIDAAKKAGVEFPFDATKEVVIEAVITQGKAELLLK